MARDFANKRAARQWVWDRLAAEGVARFPFPPHGRIPNFAGAEVAAVRLLDTEPWKSATASKVNPDSPQRRCEPRRCVAASPFSYRRPDCAAVSKSSIRVVFRTTRSTRRRQTIPSSRGPDWVEWVAVCDTARSLVPPGGRARRCFGREMAHLTRPLPEMLFVTGLPS